MGCLRRRRDPLVAEDERWSPLYDDAAVAELKNSRTGRRFTAMSEHIGQLVDDVTRLRAVLADAEAVVERHVPAAGDEIEDESGICEASTLEDIRNVLAATSSSTVRPSWAATEVPR